MHGTRDGQLKSTNNFACFSDFFYDFFQISFDVHNYFLISYFINNFNRIFGYFEPSNKITNEIFIKFLNGYFSYINPFNNELTGNPIVWFVFKALSVLIIYQIITSFRRQTRR